MRMKKFLIFGLIAIFLTAFTSMLPTEVSSVDNDIGYSLTIDQDVTVMPTIESPVLSGESFILLERGVSVPYLGLINQDMMIVDNKEDFTCNRYYVIERIDLKLPTLIGFKGHPDKYPVASDLGLRKS